MQQKKSTNYPSNFLCKIENNVEGRFFLSLLQKNLNRKRFQLKRYGRHTDRKSFFVKNPDKRNWSGDIPIENAKSWVVYLEKSNHLRNVEDNRKLEGLRVI